VCYLTTLLIADII